MEIEKLKWAEEHKEEIIYLHKNKNNEELLKVHKTEIKHIEEIIKLLSKEYRQRSNDVREYLENNNNFNQNNGVINKYYPHLDKNNIYYMLVYEIRKYGLKIDIVSGITGWCINLRTLENLSQYKVAETKARILSKLKSNNIEIVEKPKNPYVDEFHITVYEKGSETPIEDVANQYIEILKIFQ